MPPVDQRLSFVTLSLSSRGGQTFLLSQALFLFLYYKTRKDDGDGDRERWP